MSDLHVKTPGGSRAAFLALKHALGTADATHHTHGERHDASSACAAHPFLGAGARVMVAVSSSKSRLRLNPVPPMSAPTALFIPVTRPTPERACLARASASSMGYGPRLALTASPYVGWSARANPASARSAARSNQRAEVRITSDRSDDEARFLNQSQVCFTPTPSSSHRERARLSGVDMRAARLLRAAVPRAIVPRRARVAAASSSKATMTSVPSSSDSQKYKFGPIDIPASQVFYETPLSLGLVNLKPVVPGHVLVVSRRVVARFADLTPEETTDLWSLAKKVGTCVESHFGATSLTYAIQDGPAAGQTVPHVHVHVLPRKPGDFENNDEVYEHIEKSGERVGEREATNGDEREKAFMGKEVIREQPGERLDLDAERVVRTANEMAEEAKQLRALLDASK